MLGSFEPLSANETAEKYTCASFQQDFLQMEDLSDRKAGIRIARTEEVTVVVLERVFERRCDENDHVVCRFLHKIDTRCVF